MNIYEQQGTLSSKSSFNVLFLSPSLSLYPSSFSLCPPLPLSLRPAQTPAALFDKTLANKGPWRRLCVLWNAPPRAKSMRWSGPVWFPERVVRWWGAVDRTLFQMHTRKLWPDREQSSSNHQLSLWANRKAYCSWCACFLGFVSFLFPLSLCPLLFKLLACFPLYALHFLPVFHTLSVSHLDFFLSSDDYSTYFFVHLI